MSQAGGAARMSQAGVARAGAGSVLVCSAADRGFFPLLKDLVQSLLLVRQRGTAGDAGDFAMAVLDLGLEDGQRQWLAERSVCVVAPGWDIDFPARPQTPDHFRSQIARLFLPRHFPGHDRYLWLDADTWVQDGAVLHWLARACSGGKMAVAEEWHPAYRKVHLQSELGMKGMLVQILYGEDEARSWGLTPSVNSGVFALEATAPHWTVWQQELSALLQRTSERIVDQMSLEYTLHHHRLPVVWMPARANWVVSQALPALCAERGRLVDPLPPHDPLWVVHLALGSKDLPFEVPFLDGRCLTSRLRLSDIGPLLGLEARD